jgi:Ca2+-transporting ATPase
VVTAVLAVGVQRMAARHAVVRRLAAVETLGAAAVIATDKTGTLTKNEMTVRRLVTASGEVSFSGAGYDPSGALSLDAFGPSDASLRHELERALAVAHRASNAELIERDGRPAVLGDPMEGALLVAAEKAGLTGAALEARLPRIDELPFTSERKLMSTVHRDEEADGQLVVFTKGAPDVLLGRCTQELVGAELRPLDRDRRAAILASTDALADEALRTLAVAARRLPPGHARPPTGDAALEQDLVLVGIVGMLDPPRPEARASVERARRAGIRTVMITGDHPRTAAVIARELGIDAGGRVLSGAELDQLDDEALAECARDVSVYARVSPAHKLRIVHALKRDGSVVAMTGDGVNDAPALKAADIGVAMGLGGTEVAREAADIVLTDDDFASIVAAVEEGRAIFANIRKFLRYLLTSNVGEVLAMFAGVLLARPLGLAPREGEAVVLPLLATQILWTNLVSDGAPALALGLDPADPTAMREPPKPPREPVVTPGMWWSILWGGALIAAGTLFVLDATTPGGFVEGAGDLRHGQTMAFTTLVLFQMFNVLNARSDTASAFVGLFDNRWLWAAIGASVALQVAVVHVPALQLAFGTVPLELEEWALAIGVASSVLWVKEATTLVARRGSGAAAEAPSAGGRVSLP